MSLIRKAAYLAIGMVWMVGPIIGCTRDDYSYSFGGAASSSGRLPTSSSSSGATTNESEELCDRIDEGTYCDAQSKKATSCERGPSASARCNAHFTCLDDAWTEEAPTRAFCAPASVCPAGFTTSAPDLCQRPDAVSLLCEYDEGTCGCAPVAGVHHEDPDENDAGDAGTDAGDADAGTAMYEWRCVPPPRDPETSEPCPRQRPRAGLSCVRPMKCDYGNCVFEDGLRMDCYLGSWLQRSERCEQ